MTPMTESQATGHRKQRRRKHSGDNQFGKYFKLAVNILAPVILFVIAAFTDDSLLVISIGALGAVLITLTRAFKQQTLFFLSILSVLSMLMLEMWRWTDMFMIPVITAEITADVNLFSTGLLEIVLALLAMILYQRQLSKMTMKINFDWYSPKTYKKFILILVYFFVFLTIFLILGFSAHSFLSGRSYNKNDVSIGVAVAAFLMAGIPALIHLLRKPAEHHHSSHRRSHRHSSSSAE